MRPPIPSLGIAAAMAESLSSMRIRIGRALMRAPVELFVKFTICSPIWDSVQG
jgi:hypothetical protein